MNASSAGYTELPVPVMGDEGPNTLQGTSDTDFMFGQGGDDTLYGYDGDDQLHGDTGDDTLYGGGGDDVLFGEPGADRLYGGAGDDWYVIDSSDDYVWENAGEGTHDHITVQETDYQLAEGSEIEGIGLYNFYGPSVSNSNLTGNSFGQVISGNDGNNILDGRGGDDSINGRGGNDTIYGGDGNDYMTAGAGVDVLYGGAGNDHYDLQGDTTNTIFEDAGGGYDTVEVDYSYSIADIDIEALFCWNREGNNVALVGNGLNNVISSSLGNDTIYGRAGDDKLSGGGGDDVLDGGTGNDKINGDMGNDRLLGGEGDDELYGGHGDDVLVGGAGIDQFFGGYGNDTFVIDNPNESITEEDNQGTDTVVVDFSYSLRDYFENLSAASILSTNAIDLIGNARDNVLTGNAGSNLLSGSYGSDTLYGNGGNDTLIGGQGNDLLSGGSGADTFIFVAGDGDDIVTDLTAGDLVRLSSYYTAQSITQVGSDVVVVLSDTDRITFQNTALEAVRAALSFEGVQPPKYLVGTPGNDTLIGGSGDDGLSGGAGNDILDGRAGRDSMAGGTGNDVYYVDDAYDVVGEKAGEGTDTIRSSVSYRMPSNVEIGILEGTAAINLEGSYDDNRLEGNSGNNSLFGMPGNDTLLGGGGNDLLNGGFGTDTLTGGAGADVFQFEHGCGNDTITDFQSGVDKLDLHLLGISSGNVKMKASKGNMLLQIDDNHDGHADFTITLVGVTKIAADDFHFA